MSRLRPLCDLGPKTSNARDLVIPYFVPLILAVHGRDCSIRTLRRFANMANHQTIVM